MGYYLEPATNIPGKPSKKDFCEKEGKKLPDAQWPDDPDVALVCLMFNGAWWAAGVCYSKREMGAFNDPNDGRQRTWFWIPKEKCYESMAPLDAQYLRKAFKSASEYEARHA
jgi:hypothetical protein